MSPIVRLRRNRKQRPGLWLWGQHHFLKPKDVRNGNGSRLAFRSRYYLGYGEDIVEWGNFGLFNPDIPEEHCLGPVSMVCRDTMNTKMIKNTKGMGVGWMREGGALDVETLHIER